LLRAITSAKVQQMKSTLVAMVTTHTLLLHQRQLSRPTHPAVTYSNLRSLDLDSLTLRLRLRTTWTCSTTTVIRMEDSTMHGLTLQPFLWTLKVLACPATSTSCSRVCFPLHREARLFVSTRRAANVSWQTRAKTTPVLACGTMTSRSSSIPPLTVITLGCHWLRSPLTKIHFMASV